MSAGVRQATIRRDTAETKINLTVNLDGQGTSEISTGVAFFDHMLTLFSRHALIDLKLKADGDTDVDYHHTVEDVGIVLGQAIKEALGDKAGIRRYGFFILPMDETLARCVIDLSNRPMMVYQVEITNYMVKDFNIALVREFFQGFANALGCNLHLKLEYGEEPHHIAEALFKAFARALRAAVEIDARQGGRVPSTKGTLA
ncbi:MAG: imidazoleglycerol-phosphate dehydratase HisB [Verrucomicrobia bacterium]|jgi:imidazoleglycerol-phosphate dehydratase|nr:imidazoleglycerol-phosphate dehydratase HisB [Verrucomicrobiota bacterium]NBR42051.1 imidazoleglycerol-phosphate dehydratase HisB [Verrucomicrobiota bacterium]NBS04511.1 imidazoleglycerol-phosphate dehydratase HisB [Verrucomicrobiota bacterium]NBY37683.1 imidazoleglycerol-phosphate dehydratase HisB [Verrucomicrobiota bacterium]